MTGDQERDRDPDETSPIRPDPPSPSGEVQWPTYQPPDAPPAAYGQPSYPAYPPHAGGSSGYGASPYGSAYPPTPYGVVVPNESKAVASLVVGIIALAGTVLCGLFIFGLPAFLGPVAWVLGATSRGAIDRSNGALGGRAQATAGMVLGIITTALLVLFFVLFVLVVAFSGF